jgi:glutaminyl-tRNA synthetase
MAEAASIARLTAIGLDSKVAADVATNKKLLPQLFATLEEASVADSCDKNIGLLLYSLTTKIPSSCIGNRVHVARLIGQGKIDSAAKLDGALAYIKTIGGDAPVEADLHKASGVGVVVTESDVASAVAATIAEYKEGFVADRYRGPKGPALAQLRRTIPFADQKRVMEVFETQLEALLGPMTEADKAPPTKVKPAAAKPAAAAPAAAAAAAAAPAESSDVVNTRDWKLPHPRENIDSGDGYCNSQDILQRHLKETGGRYITRFPPEPNGYLHIGHAKAMSLDFGIARKNGGDTILRFDDTNPEAESQECAARPRPSTP